MLNVEPTSTDKYWDETLNQEKTIEFKLNKVNTVLHGYGEYYRYFCNRKEIENIYPKAIETIKNNIYIKSAIKRNKLKMVKRYIGRTYYESIYIKENNIWKNIIDIWSPSWQEKINFIPSRISLNTKKTHRIMRKRKKLRNQNRKIKIGGSRTSDTSVILCHLSVDTILEQIFTCVTSRVDTLRDRLFGCVTCVT